MAMRGPSGNEAREPVRPNRAPIGQVSRGVSEALNTPGNLDYYSAIGNYAIRGNYIPGRPEGNERGLPKLGSQPNYPQNGAQNQNPVIPDDALPYVGKNLDRNLMSDQNERMDSAKTFKRPGSKGPVEVRRGVNYTNNPGFTASEMVGNSMQRPDGLEMRVNNLEKILKEVSYQFDAMSSKYDLMVKRERLGDNNDSDLRIRLEQSIRQIEEHNHVMTTDIINRMSGLESRLANEERVKGQLKEKLMIAEQNFKEISNFIQTFQKLDNSELNQMRILIQDKISEDQQLFMREKVKGEALFNEVVRLGQLQEKQAKDIYSLNSDFDQRVRGIESKMVLNEQAMTQLATKGETGINYMSEWNEKLDNRVQQLETNLVGLGREQMKDRDNLGRLDASTQKLADDLKQLLSAIQTDYQARLDSKISEVLNRISIEHEERRRAEEDIKNQMEVRTKLHEEKMNYEKEEMRDRYMAMDSLVRAEFQRKEESIRSLGDLFESNVKKIQTALKQEEITRDQFEAAIRIEMQKMQEILNKDLDFFKSQFALENEKITEIIKGEIDTRFSSDVELKNLTNLMLSSITTEINEFKGAVEKQHKLFAAELKEVSADSADRDNQLSRFVEMETKKVLENANGKYDKLKYLLTRVAEQFKAHLKKYEKTTLDLRTDINDNTLKLNEIFGDLTGNIGTIEQKVVEMVTHETNKLQRENDHKMRLLQDSLRKLNEQQNGDFEVMKEAIKNEGEIFNSKLDRLAELSEQYHKSNFLNLKLLVGEIDKMRASLTMLDKELENKWQELANKFIDTRADFISLVSSESAKRKDFDEYLESRSMTIQRVLEMSIQDTDKRFGSVEGSMKRGFDETNTRLSQLTDSDQSLEKMIQDSTENSKKQWAKTLEDLNNNVVFAKTIELMCRTLSARTYTEFGQLQGLLEGLVKLVQEEKSQQVKESESLRQILFDLNKRVDVELPDAINASVLKVLEDVKAENAKIWEVCLDYAQKTDPKSQDKLLKKSDRLNNYSYAVGGRDSFKIPKLGFTATQAGRGTTDSPPQDPDASGTKSNSKPSVSNTNTNNNDSKQTAGKSSAGKSGPSQPAEDDDEDQDN